MELSYKQIQNEVDIKTLSALAHKIWNAHYPPIIGQKQVDYMLGKMYSVESLNNQIFKEGHHFIAAYYDDKMEGFISYSSKNGEDYIIHKLYVNTEIHRKGTGSALFSIVFGNRKFETIRLTVNRQNITAINFYFKIGFVIEKIIDIDLGEGFVMNDFVMLFSNDNLKVRLSK